ncbi:hypothetical protein A2592_00985 [Candidatus Kaiserbacteria bacterium RIFOXYD1_FULL_42_15]|uniref:Uncharacterized protein n=1 Tax=Candidatus Kaiserbacteria bacterium RIFOXYD1_FULL_42_15 TaxID=1798532 RepID=A0A1F6FPB4_9BACT|nr:MAG: hypothetical protein A2592_00985 [Candidatus Kaiserbacteria bacterium RIFOXYD1_FULL_42_15]
MENQNNNSGVNTVLIVIVIMIIVGGLVWFFARPVAEEKKGFEVDVNLPAGNNADPVNTTPN